jgi:hypothetical protein
MTGRKTRIMACIKYAEITIQKRNLALIEKINSIIDVYQQQGYNLTLRQVYYQLVSRDFIENTEKSYKHIGELVNNGRLAGLIDWDAIEDRTRSLRCLPHWKAPENIIQDAAAQYRRDLWESQPRYVEVWVEKDALIGIVETAAERLDTPCFSCRGYTSQTAVKDAAHRIIIETEAGKDCIIIHLGDHDPSGIDMTRDIRDRLGLFGASVEVNRIALNMPQVELFAPPPNPAKITDTRAAGYIKKYGVTSWELDAIEPAELDRLITNAIESNLDRKLYDAAKERQESERKAIYKMIDCA